MPYGQPSQRANLKPFQPGNTAGGRTREVDKASRLARRHCPEAILYAVEVLRDLDEATRFRIKAAEMILAHGMPKGPEKVEAFLRHVAAASTGVDADGFIEVRFVHTGQVEAKPNGQGTFSVEYDAE